MVIVAVAKDDFLQITDVKNVQQLVKHVKMDQLNALLAIMN